MQRVVSRLCRNPSVVAFLLRSSICEHYYFYSHSLLSQGKKSSAMEIQHVEIEGQKIYDGKPFPLCISPDPNSSITSETFQEWLISNRNELDDMLREYKAIYFCNFPLSNVHDFHDVVEATGYKNMPYVGGAAVRTAVTRRVFTANESPPSEKIPFHHEMAQVPHPPTHLFFYCETPALQGGEVNVNSPGLAV
jgi:hypothetical protein